MRHAPFQPARLLALLAGFWWLGPVGLVPRADAQTPLQAVIDSCQPKMVKVFGASAGRVEGYATGIIVSAEGAILTASGVFLDGQQVRVLTADGVEHVASVIRRDRVKQLALLRIAAATPEFFELVDEPVGRKGDWVVAVSNAFKVADKREPLSATLGVISLRTSLEARLNERDLAYQGNLVLIDAITSNPGAAGGAVVKLDGKLVGMIGKVIDSSETNTRLNYAVPAADLKAFVSGDVSSIAQNETTTERPPVELGIVLFQQGGRNAPAYVDRVVRRSPAWKARLRADDLIISLGGIKVGTVDQYEEALARLTPDVETLLIIKRGSELLRIPITPVPGD